MLKILMASKGQKFLLNYKKFTSVQQRMTPENEENITNDQLLYLNYILSHWPMQEQELHYYAPSLLQKQMQQHLLRIKTVNSSMSELTGHQD